MAPKQQVVITGVGVVSPIGIGRDPFWSSLTAARSGVGPITLFDTSGTPVGFGGEVSDFEPKQYVTPRKSLKVMSRDIQLGVSAAALAAADAGLDTSTADPERMGVIFGADMIQCQPEEIASAYARCMEQGQFNFQLWGQRAFDEIYPLWMLKYLPNMPACHVAIAHDARGPNNSIALGEVSSLLAISEALRVIERGEADVLFAGGTGSRVHPTIWVRSCGGVVSRRHDAPQRASRPFDADRDGMVNGEGAAVFILETRQHAEARRAKILARVASYASRFEAPRRDRPPQGTAIRSAIQDALRAAELRPSEVGHVNAHGLSGIEEDAAEAQAIRDVLGDVPVTAPKSFFGNLGSGAGAVEMAVSLLALEHGSVPVTLNYERPDPKCPVEVVHDRPLGGRPATALLLNQAPMGQSMALVLRAD